MTTHSHQSIKPPCEEFISSRRWKDNIIYRGGRPIIYMAVWKESSLSVACCWHIWAASEMVFFWMTGVKRAGLAMKKTWALFSLFFSSQPYAPDKFYILRCPAPLHFKQRRPIHGSISTMCLLCSIYMHGSMGCRCDMYTTPGWMNCTFVKWRTPTFV